MKISIFVVQTGTTRMKKKLLFLLLINVIFCQLHAFDNIKFHTLSQKGGLSYDGIIDIKQDGKGFIWILLSNNLFRFDGYSYKSFKEYFRGENETLWGYFNNLAIDQNGDLYVSSSKGIDQYNYTTDTFIKVAHGPAQAAFIDSNNNLFYYTEEGLFLRPLDDIANKKKENEALQVEISTNQKSFRRGAICENENDVYFFSHYGKIYQYDSLNNRAFEWADFEDEFDNAVLVSATIKQGELWLLTHKFSIFKIDLATKKITYSYTHPHYEGLNVRSFYVSDEGLAWVGTMNGLYIVDTHTGKAHLYLSDDNIPFSLPNSSVWTIYEDNKQNVWLGTYMGSLVYVNKFEEKIFESYHQSPEGLNKVPVSGFSQMDNLIFISTEGGGINVLDTETQKISFIKQNQGGTGLSSNNTKSTVVDKEGNIWISTFRGGLNRYNSATKQFTHFQKQTNREQSLYSNNLRKIVLEADSGLWVIYQEHAATISYFSFADHSITHFLVDKELQGSMSYDYIFDACGDQEGRLWLIASYWLFSVDVASKDVRRFAIQSKNNPASTLCIDDKGLIWIGTLGNELICFDPKKESFHSYAGILKSSIAEIFSINHSSNQNNEQIIWLGTNDGLYMYNTVTESCVVYKESDGTQGNVYYPLSTYKSKEGLLFFGGTEGFTIIYPEKVRLNPQKTKAFISDFYIDNHSILSTKLIRKSDLKISNNLTEVILNHTQQNFGVQLSSDNYLNADKNMFRYRLKNYDNRWIETNASNRIVFYSKIPAGKYLLEVQAANNDGIWGDIVSTSIIRRQAPWLTIPAKLLYLLLFSLLIYYLYSTYRKRKKLELRLYLDQLEREKNEEIHKNQLQFFTNISHDLKTPLSLIMITINKMREEGMREYYYRILNNNSERLLRLLNDLLDFRKTQHNKVALKVAKDDLGKFIQTLSGDFQEYAVYKEINYQIVTDDEKLSDVPFDRKVFEKIVMNLLINSFKYTRRGDAISVIAGTKQFKSKYQHSYGVGEENLRGESTFSIVIRDTGIGISEDSISKIFERFYQVESNNHNKNLGTGIGLALVKNLVLLHKGSITIYSEENVGTDFVLSFSASLDHYLPEEIDQHPSPDAERETHFHRAFMEDFDQTYKGTSYKDILPEDVPTEDYLREKTILLAEDNIALRSIIKSSLREKFEVIDFDDGKPAMEYLKNNNVDLIISDIMMQEVDGITFCKSVKNNMSTSHIPFIMLTAKSGLESMLEGTESGADLYFEKPIELTLLKTAIGNIFKQQEVLREYYAKNYFAEISSVSHNKQDSQFLKEVTEIIDAHLDQSDLDVNTIASKMMMSRSKLYAKLKALTGKSVVEFILNYRLRRAAKLLVEKNMTIQEAMFSVGIESQSYFTRAFKKEFDMTPSKFVQKFKQESTSPASEEKNGDKKTDTGSRAEKN